MVCIHFYFLLAMETKVDTHFFWFPFDVVSHRVGLMGEKSSFSFNASFLKQDLSADETRRTEAFEFLLPSGESGNALKIR